MQIISYSNYDSVKTENTHKNLTIVITYKSPNLWRGFSNYLGPRRFALNIYSFDMTTSFLSISAIWVGFISSLFYFCFNIF